MDAWDCYQDGQDSWQFDLPTGDMIYIQDVITDGKIEIIDQWDVYRASSGTLEDRSSSYSVSYTSIIVNEDGGI